MQSSTEYLAPPDLNVRERLRQLARSTAEKLSGATISAESLEASALRLLTQQSLPTAYQGWLMVILASCYWQPQIRSIPFHRRLLLLPTARHTDDRWRGVARQRGYQLIDDSQWEQAEEIVRAGHVDAVLGIAELGGLERAMDRVIQWGLPCMAEPVFATVEQTDTVDQEWVQKMIDLPFEPQQVDGASESSQQIRYRRLMQAAQQLFQADYWEPLLPRTDHSGLDSLLPAAFNSESESNGHARIGSSSGPTRHELASREGSNDLRPLEATAAIAHDFVSRGGKYARPFITLAVYDAFNGNRADSLSVEQLLNRWSSGVKRTAVSIEVFHKASLVHDDIEDDDDFRYGQPSIHKKYGVATAINVGDFLVGLGYRLVSGCAAELGGMTVARILDCLADAHQRLSEGQGAELMWRDQGERRLSPADAIRVYMLKTSPAFEVALRSGLRLANVEGLDMAIIAYANCLGAAFQILNDLKDWCEDSTNKGTAGGDVVGGRPTLLWALALSKASESQTHELLQSVASESIASECRLAAVRRIYSQLEVFQTAVDWVQHFEQRAQEIVNSLPGDELKPLLTYLIEAVLQRPVRMQELLVHA